MISLRSEIFPDFFQKKINHTSKVTFIGSCFSENIGAEFKKAKIPCLINPYGVLYNPASVSLSISNILENKRFTENDLAFFNEKWISFEHHGLFSGNNLPEVLEKINKTNDIAHGYLKKTEVLFLTFGTAWIYELKDEKKIVANCHKLPASNFKHFLLQVDEITTSYKKILADLRKFNPQLEIVFTVSPVRHWKDGAVNNQLSKSTLITAVHQLVAEFNFAHYFPSYEIMMDDLRDYRFYADDLFHPNQLAVNYIWGKFSQAFFSSTTMDMMKKIEKLRKNVEHKVFYPKTEAYKKFLANNLKLIKNLKKEFPQIEFNSEFDHFKKEAEKFWPGVF